MTGSGASKLNNPISIQLCAFSGRVDRSRVSFLTTLTFSGIKSLIDRQVRHMETVVSPHGCLLQMREPSILAALSNSCKYSSSAGSPTTFHYPTFHHLSVQVTDVPLSLIPISLSIMPVTTRKSNANVHPGDIVRNAQQKKRTKKEIEDEKAKAKADSIAAREEAARKNHAVILNIARLKASVEREEGAIRAHTNRPDLYHSSSNMTRTASVQGNQVPARAQKYGNIVHDSTA